MKLKKPSISKNLEVLCTLIACVMSPCFNYRLTTPPHTANKPPDLILWNLIPFFKKSLSELLYRCWLHGRGGGVIKQLSVTYPKHALLDLGPGIHTDDCGLFEILIGDAGSMSTRIVIHQNEIFPTTPAYGRT